MRLAAVVASVCSVSAAPPRPDHVVVVVLENRSYTEVIGSPDAPFLNFLARNGAYFTNFLALTHPSQPNYLHLFSGENQGVWHNLFPAGTPFSTPNLGAALRGAGFTFGGYCEDLPEVGSNVEYWGHYVRRHNPWVNWQADPPGPNQLPPEVNMPFTGFPQDYHELPHVSFVIPNQLHNMHDGTVAMADTWLFFQLAPYAVWTHSNNSLLIVTFDEDSFASRNFIPTIFFGPMIRQGAVPTTWTLHNLLRTIEDMFDLPHAGLAANVAPIVGPFVSDPPVFTARFANGFNGYFGGMDTYIHADDADTERAVEAVILVDGQPRVQGLIAFREIVGSDPLQVPAGANVLSAKLMLLTGPSAATDDGSHHEVSLHAMLRPWNDMDTWNMLGDGISTDGIEAAVQAEFRVTPNVRDAWAVFDVTRSVQTWVSGEAINYGWLLDLSGSDEWRWLSVESASLLDRPRLEVTFTPGPATCSTDLNRDGATGLDDLTILLSNFGRSGVPPASGDVNGDGLVDLTDLAALLAEFGTTCQ